MSLLLSAILCLCFFSPTASAEDNPKSFTINASGDTAALAAVTGKTYLITGIAIQSTYESTAVVAVYVKSGDRNVIGSSTARIPIDKTGIDGYAGFVWQQNLDGWASGKLSEAITINCSAAQPIIVNISYRLR